MTLTFESLPNEIWLIIFTYLPSRHIWRAFFGTTKRLNELLTSNLIRHTIDLKDISNFEIIQLLEDHDNNPHDHYWQANFVSHAHAICFENEFDYKILIDQWIATKINWQLSSLQVIYVLPEALTCLYSLFNQLKFTKVFESQLHYLHLVFDDPFYTYYTFLSIVVEARISCPIMIFEVMRGYKYQYWDRTSDLYDIKHRLYWIHTVRLNISLQHSSELILLLKPEALPLLEHLNVTIEQPRKDLISEKDQSKRSIKLCEKDFQCPNTTGIKLRSFVLRQIEVDDFLILFNTLTFPLLHTLILIDIYDKSLDNLVVFQQLVGPSNLPSLKHNQFEFLFRFPAKYEQEWIDRYYKNGWPFNKIGFHVDEHIVEQLGYSSPLDIIEDVLFVYSIPFDLLKYMRTIHNYELFNRHSTKIPKQMVYQKLEWLCKWTKNDTQLISSLKIMKNVERLRCFFIGINNRYEIVKSPTYMNLCLHLRSLTFRFKQHLPYGGLPHHSILQIILDASPKLFYLNVSWANLSLCSGRYPTIKHVHLSLGWDGLDLNVNQFNRIIPNIQYLAIGGQQLIREKKIVNFACELLLDEAHFCQLILLEINKTGTAKLKPHVKENIKQAIVAKISRLHHSNMTRLDFSYYNQLSIWLC